MGEMTNACRIDCEIFKRGDHLLYIEVTASKGVEGVIRGLEGIYLADRCILTKLE
jgi:hypothetical protein